MAENSKIEWTDHTANLWWGCTKVRNNPLCDNCYANTWANRMGNDVWGDDRPRREIKDVWAKLDKWQKEAKLKKIRYRVFTMSMGDIFERSRPLVDHKGNEVSGNTKYLRDRLLENIQYGVYDNLDFLMLTKRPQNVMKMVPKEWGDWWPENVWIGTSVGDQQNANRNIPDLLDIPARTRFLSMEPLLEQVKISSHLHSIKWVIVGGESGHNSRAMKPEWVEYIRDQCFYHGVPFFFKQGSSANWSDYKNFDSFPPGLQVRQFPNTGDTKCKN